LNINYEVVVEDTQLPVEAFVEQLTNAVNSNQFTTILQAKAVELGVDALSDAISSSIQITPITPIVSSDDDNKLSGGAIAGIVIGSLFGAGLLFGIIYYFLVMKKSSSALKTPLIAETEKQNNAIFY
jgi:hypothetical protein